MKNRDIFVGFNFLKNYRISVWFRKLKIENKTFFAFLFHRIIEFIHIYSL